MAFPTVNGTVAATNNGSGTTINVTMPSGIVAGELLLLFAVVGGTGHDVAGWTEIFGSGTFSLWKKIAVGGDTAVINPDGAGSQVAGAICMRIGGWSGDLSEVTATFFDHGTGTVAPNPPSHTAVDTRDNLWFAVCAGNGSPGTAPTNYGNLSSAVLASSASCVVQARRALNALTENPGAFGGTLGNPETFTVSVPPPAFVDQAGSDTATFGITDNATIVEKTKTASDTAAFPITDNATAAIPVQKAGSDTVSFLLVDNAATPEKSTIKAASDTATFAITDAASAQHIGPLSGTWISPTVALPEDPIGGSVILWDAVVPDGTTLLIETSIDNGASWQEATNRDAVPRLEIESDSTKAVMVRATMTRVNSDIASPSLDRLEMRIAIDSSIDEYCQLGRFFLDDTEVIDDGHGLTLRLIGSDLSRRVAMNTWDETLIIEEGTNFRDAIMAIILNRWPEATFNLASTELTTTRMFFGEGIGAGNPWADAKKVARDCGWDLYLDAYGVVTSRLVPNPDLVPAVWTVTDSARPTMIKLARRMTNEATYNQVIVFGESSSNEVPVTARWRDEEPTSRTYWGGRYGKVTKTIRSDRIGSLEHAQLVADAEGLRVRGATEVVRISMLCAPFLEPGDVMEVDRTHSKTIGRFAIDGWRIALGPEELMDVTCRRQRQ